MKKRLFGLMTLVFAFTVFAAAPVSGAAALEGEQQIEFNLGFMMGGDCEHITWTGEVTLNGDIYDISYQPTGDKAAGKAFHFTEIVRIHEPGAIEVNEAGEVTVCPEASLLWLENRGSASPNLKGGANGKVQYVNPAGPFDPGLVGNTTHWRGDVSADGLSFSGSFRIN